ncbi:predicted protein [Postia placenta Mad-698-R]|uniref:Uncharacterized protein n=1 Tax=Postia placenta MAD-698-R-SB12 TaxID=670580 RepID=A0A1X6NCW2_9APHY|nr:hypothetical protein POSPLADRAFT_1053124 [Postia placenta MAD-698-R-SB12]EED81690.1 predicted protein [Postia placenta Mad-698-R]OSX66487.1 hypothetical protein POSPLADRAFT_1053124 [Postia placenta MAD-698-R-SB12]
MILIPFFIAYLVFMTNVFIAYDRTARTFGYPSLGGPLKYLQLSGTAIRQTPWLPAVRVDTKIHSAMQWTMYEEVMNSSISYVLPSTMSLDELICPLLEHEEPFADGDGNDDYNDGSEWCRALPESSLLSHLVWFHAQSASSMCALTEAPVEEPNTTPSTDSVDSLDAIDSDIPSPMNTTSKTSPSDEDVSKDNLPDRSTLAILVFISMLGSTALFVAAEYPQLRADSASDFSGKDKQGVPSDLSVSASGLDINPSDSPSIGSIPMDVQGRNRRKKKSKKRKKKASAVAEPQPNPGD